MKRFAFAALLLAGCSARDTVSTGKKDDTNANVTNQVAWIEEESIRTFKKELMELGTMITISNNKEEAQ